MKMKNEIILYQSDELAEHIEVRLNGDTVWLNRNQLATLFGRDVKTIGKHINNVFSEGELNKDSTVANFATVQLQGGRKIERQITKTITNQLALDVKKANEQYYN
jgi:hypothetical protein